MSQPTVLPITVVIPSIGGPSLLSSIASLYSGAAIPSQCLVCLPPNSPPLSQLSSYSSLEVLICPTKGQVQQRAVGLAEATQPFIMQLDDDICLKEDTLYKLYDAAASSLSPSAFAPTFLDTLSNKPWHSLPSGVLGFSENLYQSLIHLSPWGCRSQRTLRGPIREKKTDQDMGQAGRTLSGLQKPLFELLFREQKKIFSEVTTKAHR